MSPKPREFVGGRPPSAFLEFADQSQFATGAPRLLHNFWTHRKFFDALGGSQNDADPNQIVDDGRWASTLRATCLNVPNEIGGREGVRNGLAERVALQEFQVRLFASLSTRDSLKRLDVPTDQFRNRRRAELLSRQLVGVFERDFAMLCPAQRRRAMSEGPALLVEHCRAAAEANNRRVARRTVRLFACFDRRHEGFLRGQDGWEPFLSPLCPLSNQ
jgi:hypothetical protein